MKHVSRQRSSSASASKPTAAECCAASARACFPPPLADAADVADARLTESMDMRARPPWRDAPRSASACAGGPLARAAGGWVCGCACVCGGDASAAAAWGAWARGGGGGCCGCAPPHADAALAVAAAFAAATRATTLANIGLCVATGQKGGYHH